MEQTCESSVVCRGRGKRLSSAKLACLLVHTVSLCSLILAPALSSAPLDAPCPFLSSTEGHGGGKLVKARDPEKLYGIIVNVKASPTRTPHGIVVTDPHSACNLRTLTKKKCEKISDSEHQPGWPPGSSSHGYGCNYTIPDPTSSRKGAAYDTKHVVLKSQSPTAEIEAPMTKLAHPNPKQYHYHPKPWTHQMDMQNRLQLHNDEAPQYRYPQTDANTRKPHQKSMPLAIQAPNYISNGHPSAPSLWGPTTLLMITTKRHHHQQQHHHASSASSSASASGSPPCLSHKNLDPKIQIPRFATATRIHMFA